MTPVSWVLRAASVDDAGWLAELRAVVMHDDLERLGRWGPVRVRQRFLDGFRPQNSVVIVVDGVAAGMIAVRPEAREKWIEHFYLAPETQGRGIGGAVFGQILEQHDDERPFRLNVLRGSAARRLYERHGFALESEDAVDLFLVRAPATARL